jgi:hypothetical protein
MSKRDKEDMNNVIFSRVPQIASHKVVVLETLGDENDSVIVKALTQSCL